MSSAQALADDLAERVIWPLLSGGSVRPVGPIGSRRALALARTGPTSGGEAGLEIEAARLRTARELLPIDALPELTPGEWLLGCALNDLLQSTNPTLGTRWGRQRRVLDMVLATIERAGAPSTLGEALARYCTFIRYEQLEREDSYVSWWVGSRKYAGSRPPRRVVLWPRLRGVRTRRDTVSLCEMADAENGERYGVVVRAWIAASPLGDLATLTRQEPRFGLTEASLSLLSVPLGRMLAGRVIRRRTAPGRAASVLRGAAERIPRGNREARQVAISFADELEEWGAAGVGRDQRFHS